MPFNLRTLRGSEKPGAKLTDERVRALRTFVAENDPDTHLAHFRAVAEEVGMSAGAVRRAAYRETWKHVT